MYSKACLQVSNLLFISFLDSPTRTISFAKSMQRGAGSSMSYISTSKNP
jgi:hypothetical protein